MRFTCYDAATGAWTGRIIDAQYREDAEPNVPDGAVLVPLPQFPHMHRWDGAQLVSFTPSAPDVDHEWNDSAREWQLKAAVIVRRSERQQAQARVEVLEKQQARALREEAIGRGGTAIELKRRLEAIDDEIAALREQL